MAIGKAYSILLALAPHRNAQPVVLGRRGEHLDDLHVIARVRERARQQVPDLVAQLVERRARRGQSRRAEQRLQLRQRQAPHMRRIAQLLRSVPLRRLRRIIRRVHVDHHDPSARRAHPHHLAQHADRIEEMMHGEPRHHDVERAIRIGQRCRHRRWSQVTLAIPFSAASCRARSSIAGVMSMPVACLTCGANAHTTMPPPQATSSTRVARPWRGGLHDHPQRIGVRDGVRRAERRRLTGELVQDPVLVRRVAHGFLTPTDKSAAPCRGTTPASRLPTRRRRSA